MPTPVFPSINPGRDSRRRKYNRFLQADFGDGYGQRALDGVNTELEEWTLSFTDRPKSEIDTLVAFFDSLNAVDHFEWTPPDEVTAKQWVQNGEYEVTFSGFDTRSMSVPIKRVYRL